MTNGNILSKLTPSTDISLKQNLIGFTQSKLIYSEKATKFCKISTVDMTVTKYIGQIYGGDFAKMCGLLRIYELHATPLKSQ